MTVTKQKQSSKPKPHSQLCLNYASLQQNCYPLPKSILAQDACVGVVVIRHNGVYQRVCAYKMIRWRFGCPPETVINGLSFSFKQHFYNKLLDLGRF